MSASSSQNVKNSAARLMAVQALYQSSLNGQPISSAMEEYLEHRVSMDIDGEEIMQPDGALVQKILKGVEERKSDLGAVIQANTKNKGEKLEPLIKSVLMCGAYELMANQEVDAPVIINDYLNIGHAFFDSGEVSLINGVLDAVGRSVRTS